MKRFFIFLVTASIGVTSIGMGVAATNPHCVELAKILASQTRHHFSSKRKEEIATWNAAHPAWVKKWIASQKLRREMLRRLDIVCEELNYEGQNVEGGLAYIGINVDNSLYADAPELIALTSQQLIPQEPYPLYDNPSRSYSDDSGYGPGSGGWYSGGGYVGGHNPGAPPVTPIAVTPEPSSLALTVVPVLALILMRRKRLPGSAGIVENGIRG